jgi:hypothetical protein
MGAPPFDDVMGYMLEAGRQWPDRVHLGLFGDKDLIGIFDGIAFPGLELRGYGILEWGDRRWGLMVLDEQGRVWLYNQGARTGDQIDIGWAAAVLLEERKVSKKDAPTYLTHKLQKANFVVECDYE